MENNFENILTYGKEYLSLSQALVSTMQTTNNTELRNNLKQYLDSVVESNTPLVITRPGSKSVIVMSLDDYNALVETEYILSNKQLMEDLQKAEEDIKEGRVTSQKKGETIEQFLDRLKCTE